MPNVFIYAQGKGSRWGEGSDIPVPSVKKQLIPIGNELLIQRTVRQLSNNPITVFGKCESFGSLFPDNVDVCQLRDPVGSIIDGLCVTYKYWSIEGTSLILLGDVVFSNDLIRDMLNFDGKHVTFFGRMYENMFTGKNAKEIFGLAIPQHQKEEFYSILIRMVNEKNDNRFIKKLWDLTRFIVNKCLGSTYVFRDYSNKSYSDDCDSPQEWLEYGKRLVSLALYDDKMNCQGIE